MRLEWLEDILAVHDAGSLRAAADQRLLTASAFTRRIRVVEKAIGGELFDRRNKPVTLRPHVIELIPSIRELVAGLKKAQDELSGLGDNEQVTRIICQHTLSVSWAPKVAKLLTINGLQMRIKSGSKDECMLSVMKNDTDLAIVYVDPSGQNEKNSDLFDCFRFAREHFLPVASLNLASSLDQVFQVRRVPLVAYPRDIYLGEVLERVLSNGVKKGVNAAIVAESGLGPAVLEFVREGIGIGWLPLSIIKDELVAGTLIEMTDLLPQFELDVVVKKSKSSSYKRIDANWALISENFSLELV
ncbi:MAG: LysR family transcriptional regulator [Rhizobiaceae bacterium]|nr:LysR family transcriptional regulator [Rhizobiaceae bacterium]